MPFKTVQDPKRSLDDEDAVVNNISRERLAQDSKRAAEDDLDEPTAKCFVQDEMQLKRDREEGEASSSTKGKKSST